MQDFCGIGLEKYSTKNMNKKNLNASEVQRRADSDQAPRQVGK